LEFGEVFIEPFAGGASVGLTLLARYCFDHLVMVEKDHRVASFWRRVLTDRSFPREVESFICTRPNLERLRAHTSEVNSPMWVLIKNRCSFGGYISAGAHAENCVPLERAQAGGHHATDSIHGRPDHTNRGRWY